MAVVLMLGLWLGLLGLASSERLHHFLHSDSQQAHHECIVTLVSKGHLLGGLVPAVAPLAVFVDTGWCRVAEGDFPSVADLRLGSSRAPPVGSLLP